MLHDHSFFRPLFERASVGMLTANPEQRLTQCNLGFCAMLGYTRDEIIGLRIADLVSTRKERTLSPNLPAHPRNVPPRLNGSSGARTARLLLAQF